MHDIMSDMKTFTVRDLDRQPTKVLKACDVEGAVRIKSRNGRTYTIRADNGGQRIRSLPDFAARKKAIFPKPLTRKQVALVDRLVAGPQKKIRHRSEEAGRNPDPYHAALAGLLVSGRNFSAKTAANLPALRLRNAAPRLPRFAIAREHDPERRPRAAQIVSLRQTQFRHGPRPHLPGKGFSYRA